MPLSAPQDCALAHETSGGVERRALRVTRRLRHPLCRSVKRERSGSLLKVSIRPTRRSSQPRQASTNSSFSVNIGLEKSNGIEDLCRYLRKFLFSRA